MNTSFERTSGSDEWYTPKYIIDALRNGGATFDTDPCAPVQPPYEIAPLTYNKHQNGLDKEWNGNVWLNPPYSHPLIDMFVKRLVSHNNGIMLTFDRMDNRMCQELILPHAEAVFFIKGRLKFIREDGKECSGAGCGSVLIPFGRHNVDAILKSGIEGFMLYVKDPKQNTESKNI